MRTPVIAPELRSACRVHARLLDSFIELTRAELDRQTCAFAQESLRETLELMRADRKDLRCSRRSHRCQRRRLNAAACLRLPIS